MIDPGATVWPLKSCTPREGRPQKRIQEASDLPRDNHRKHNNHEFCLIILIRLPINLYSIQLTMKSFAAISTILTALAASVAAAPTPDALPAGFQPITRDEIMRRLETSSAETNPLEKRTPGGIFLCTGNDWTGQCGYTVQPFNQCIVLTAPYLRNIGSFGPDRGTLCRLTISASTCTAHGDAFIRYPGTGDLRSYNGQDIGNNITSFSCQVCTNCQ